MKRPPEFSTDTGDESHGIMAMRLYESGTLPDLSGTRELSNNNSGKYSENNTNTFEYNNLGNNVVSQIEGYNKDNAAIEANDNAAESTTDFIDILSNGFKLISTHSDIGPSGSRYLYYAVAKSPFKYANAR